MRRSTCAVILSGLLVSGLLAFTFAPAGHADTPIEPVAREVAAVWWMGCPGGVGRTVLSAKVNPNGNDTTVAFELSEGGAVRTVPASPDPGAGTQEVSVGAVLPATAQPDSAVVVLAWSGQTSRVPAEVRAAGVAPPCPPGGTTGPTGAAGPTAAAGPIAPQAADRRAPTVSAATVSVHRRSCVVRFRLDEAADVRVTLTRHGHLVRQTVMNDLRAGKHQISLRASRKSGYVVKLVPTDQAGNRGALVRKAATAPA